MMNEDMFSTIESLRQALVVSPDNLPLRNLYVDNLVKSGMTDEALSELISLLRKYPENEHYRLLLAGIYYRRFEISKGIVIVEEFVKNGKASYDMVKLYINLLIKEDRPDVAAKMYRELIIDSDFEPDEDIEVQLSSYLSNTVSDELPEFRFHDETPPGRIEKPVITFDDVGGMSQVKEEISFKIIRPIQHGALFAAYGKKTGGGILLFGPPGCGKTYVSRATAGETGSTYISIGIHEILDMYIGESENNLHRIFDYARRHTPAVLFFDEADALGASRTDMKTSAGRYVINQFLMEMDGDKYSNEGVLILASTNAPWHLDSAFLRPGRFDRIIFVPPPDFEARIAILKVQLKGKPVENIDYRGLAGKTAGFSGADLAGLVDVAVENVLREVLKSGSERPLSNRDLSNACKMVKPSTKEWFSTAKNYVIYANENGFYDAVAQYLKITE